jgi:hypothetical protein
LSNSTVSNGLPARAHGGQRVGHIDLGLPVRAHQQHTAQGDVGQDGVDKGQRQRGGPLQVIQDQHHRPFG